MTIPCCRIVSGFRPKYGTNAALIEMCDLWLRHIDKGELNGVVFLDIRKAFDSIKGTVSPAQRCDFVGVKLEKAHEVFQVCRICGKGVVFYNMAQYGLLHHKSLCN